MARANARRSRLGLALLMALAGCADGGRMQVGSELARTGGTSSGQSGAFGGTSAAGGVAPTAATAGAGSVEARVSPYDNCLYPYPAVEPLSGYTDVVDYVASMPFPIDVPAARWGALSGTFDVNGDWVSDVLFRDRSEARFRLLVSGPPQAVLDLREVDCDALAELPVGRMFLRDLDADGIVDFIIGLETRIVAFLNRPEGVAPVLDYELPGPTARIELVSLDAVDLDGDERVDLVVSYDRVPSEAELGFETGVLGFVQGADHRFLASGAVSSAWKGGTYDSNPFRWNGYAAAGRFRAPGAASVIAPGTRPGGGGPVAIELDLLGGAPPTELPLPDLGDSVHEVFALPTPDGQDLLAIVGDEAFHVVDLRDGGATLLYSVPLAYAGGASHELGGGPEQPRYYFYDFDRDGDEDFLERGGTSTARQLTVHVNLANALFAAPQTVDVGTAAFAEAPFVNVGPARGVVDEAASSALEPDAGPTPVIHTLVSIAVAVK